MSKKYNGFTFVEMLVSLGIWLFLALMLLPSFTQVLVERKNEALKGMAHRLLNEELQTVDLSIQGEKAIKRNQIVYTIRWNLEEDELVKACISWYDYSERFVERCRYVKYDEK
jgi:competence protein ComGE